MAGNRFQLSKAVICSLDVQEHVLRSGEERVGNLKSKEYHPRILGRILSKDTIQNPIQSPMLENASASLSLPE